MQIKAKILPIASSNIDTDQIIPARYLTGISKEGLGQYLLEDVPNSPINDEKYKGAKAIVTLENFGCGSSREHAVWAIMDRGFQAVIAVSFARIFEENCYNNGLVPVKLEAKYVEEILKDVQGEAELEIDVINQTLKYQAGKDIRELKFDLDPLKKEFILKGGFMKFLEAKVPDIKKWEATAK